MNDWVVSIGTGPSQAPLIRAAQSAGYRVLGVDRTPDLELVEKALTVSTHDSDGFLQALQVCPERSRICAVLARTSGPAVLSAAKSAEVLGLPGIGCGLAAASLSKSALREAAYRAGVLNMGGKCVSEPPKWEDGADWVIKPDQPLYGKKNVYRIRCADDLLPAFEVAASESVNGRVEFQPYYAGRDIGVALALIQGRPFWNFVYEELVSERNGRFCGVGVSGPARCIPPETYHAMTGAAERLTSLWSSTGFVFFSFRLLASGSALLYEVNPGLCGDGLADRLFPALWPGTNFFELDVDIMTGREPLMPQSTENRTTLIGGRLLTDDEFEAEYKSYG